MVKDMGYLLEVSEEVQVKIQICNCACAWFVSEAEQKH